MPNWEKHFHINKVDHPISDAHKAVDEIKKQLPAKYHDMFEIIAVCIFETTLVRELGRIF